jgi:hypothetical protein
MLRRARRDAPELGDVLQGEMHRLARGKEASDTFNGECVAGMRGLHPP